MFLGTSIRELAGHYELVESGYAELGTMEWVKATFQLGMASWDVIGWVRDTSIALWLLRFPQLNSASLPGIPGRLPGISGRLSKI